MTSSLRFSDIAELRNEKVDPATCSGSRYVGLEHIEQHSLSLSGWGTAEDVDSQKQRFYEGDVLFGKLRPYFRKVVIAPFDGICSTDIWVVKPVIASDRDFVFYWMASNDFITRATIASEGTRMPRAKWDWVSGFELPEMSLGNRKIVGRTLRVIDQTISLNRSIAKTLEEIAQTVFRSWFIHFDPVKAKMAGEKPVGMDDATAALFPYSMEDSELGLIPRGWSVQEFGEVNHLLMGQSPPGDTYNSIGEGVPFYQGRTDFGLRFPKQRVFCTSGTRFAKAGEVLISVRAPVGDLNQAIEDCVIGRGVASAMHKSGNQAYSYALLCGLKPRLAYYNGEGTVFGAINRSDFSSLKVVEPPRQLVESFETVAGPLNDEIRNLFIQTESLTELRDSILPRLISGELQIPEEMLVS